MTTDRREKVLRQVRALLDKAASTTYEPEREALIAKADQLMMAYTIESWELEMAKPAGTREKPELRNYDYGETGDAQVNRNLSDIFYALARHLGIKVGWFGWHTSKIVGYRADLDYLDLLFTNIRLHLAASIVPRPDPELSYEENLALLKESGYKWQQVYDFMLPLYPDRFPSARADMEKYNFDQEWHYRHYPKTLWEESATFTRQYRKVNEQVFLRTIPRNVGVRFTKEYTTFCGETGRQRIYADPGVYRRSFAEAYANRVETRIALLRADRSSVASGKELLLANRSGDLDEFFWDAFPDLRPHAADCECDKCHARRCEDQTCKRPFCVQKRKPVRHQLPAELKTDYSAWRRGKEAADKVDLTGSRTGLRHAKELDQ